MAAAAGWDTNPSVEVQGCRGKSKGEAEFGGGGTVQEPH